MKRKKIIPDGFFLYTDLEGVLYVRHASCGRVVKRTQVGPPNGMVDLYEVLQATEAHACKPWKLTTR